MQNENSSSDIVFDKSELNTYQERSATFKLIAAELVYHTARNFLGEIQPVPAKLLQSNSIIVDSIIVENSKIVDDLAATEDFYLIKIHNSRNSKIVELFFWRGCEKFSLFPMIFAFIFSKKVLHPS